jgi:hypothetical protein
MTTLSDTTTAPAAERISASTAQERIAIGALMVVLVLTNVLFFAVALPYVH